MRIVAIALGSSLAFAGLAQATPSIGIHSPGIRCDGTMTIPGGVVDIDITAFAPLGEPGVQGAEFAIVGVPANVFVLNVAASSAAFSTEGTPFGPGGARIALLDCWSGTEVVLYRAILLAFGPVGPFELQVVAHPQPTPPGTDCPNIRGCDAAFHCARRVLQPSTLRIVSPQPADRANAVPLGTPLSWSRSGGGSCGCDGVDDISIYFGTETNPPLIARPRAEVPFDPPGLQPETTYYWRVVIEGCASATSPVWSFTTDRLLAVDSRSWSKVKSLYRTPR